MIQVHTGCTTAWCIGLPGALEAMRCRTPNVSTGSLHTGCCVVQGRECVTCARGLPASLAAQAPTLHATRVETGSLWCRSADGLVWHHNGGRSGHVHCDRLPSGGPPPCVPPFSAYAPKPYDWLGMRLQLPGVVLELPPTSSPSMWLTSLGPSEGKVRAGQGCSNPWLTSLHAALRRKE